MSQDKPACAAQSSGQWHKDSCHTADQVYRGPATCQRLCLHYTNHTATERASHSVQTNRPKPAQPTESQPWGWSHCVQMLMDRPVGGGDPSSLGTKPQKRLNQHLDTVAPHSSFCFHCTSPRGGSDPLRSLLPALHAGHSPSVPRPAGAAQRTGLRSYGGGTTPGSATRG